MSSVTGQPVAKPAGFDNDADFISFDNDEDVGTTGGTFQKDKSEPPAASGFSIKGRADRDRNKDEVDMDLDSSSDDRTLPSGVQVTRQAPSAPKPNPQEAAISASNVLNPAGNSVNPIPNGPTYSGGYSSLIRPASGMIIKGAGASASLPPPPQTFISQNLNTAEASASTPRKKSKYGKKDKKRKSAVLEEDDYDEYAGEAFPNSHGEYLPWVKDVEWFNEDKGGPAGVLKLFNQESRVAAGWLAPTPHEHEARDMLVTIITDIIRGEFKRDAPFMEVEAFGSHVNQLYLPGGDIDIVIVKDSLPPRLSGIKGIRNLFYRILDALRYRGVIPSGDNRSTGVQMILQARCPIVKLKTLQGNIAVDISVYDDGGIRTSRLVRGYLKEYPVARDLVLLVKAYMRRHKVNEVFLGGLGSYATFCLVISFLQNHESIQRKAIDPQRNLGVLLQEFFDLYANFEWETYGISLRHGGAYFRKADRNWGNGNGNGNPNSRSIAIEDPQNSTNNISKGSTDLNRIFACWEKAVNILDANIEQQEHKWEQHKGSNQPALWLDSRGEWDQTKMSMLKDILGFKADALDHRRALDDLYWSGNLQRILKLPPPGTSKGMPRGKHSRFDREDSRDRGGKNGRQPPARNHASGDVRREDSRDREGRNGASSNGRGSRGEGNYAIHMNDDPRSQHVSDNSDDEPQALDRLAQKSRKKAKSSKADLSGKTETSDSLSAARSEKKGHAKPSQGSKEAEMGLDDDDDERYGAAHRPIEVDDDGDIEIIEDPSQGQAKTIHYRDTFPSEGSAGGKNTDRSERYARRSGRSRTGRDATPDVSREDSALKSTTSDQRKKYWADKGPREAHTPPPAKAPKAKKNGKSQADSEKMEDFSNIQASATDAIEQNADFVSFF